MTLTELPLRGPQFALIERDHSLEQVYQAGFLLNQFMSVNSNGIVTARDSLTIDNNRDVLRARMEAFRVGKPEQMRQQFGLESVMYFYEVWP